jgi:Protein of unknown function (DUF2589)
MFMKDEFKGLPMGDLIGGPLMAACESARKFAMSNTNDISEYAAKGLIELKGNSTPNTEIATSIMMGSTELLDVSNKPISGIEPESTAISIADCINRANKAIAIADRNLIIIQGLPGTGEELNGLQLTLTPSAGSQLNAICSKMGGGLPLPKR